METAIGEQLDCRLKNLVARILSLSLRSRRCHFFSLARVALILLTLPMRSLNPSSSWRNAGDTLAGLSVNSHYPEVSLPPIPNPSVNGNLTRPAWQVKGLQKATPPEV